MAGWNPEPSRRVRRLPTSGGPFRPASLCQPARCLGGILAGAAAQRRYQEGHRGCTKLTRKASVLLRQGIDLWQTWPTSAQYSPFGLTWVISKGSKDCEPCRRHRFDRGAPSCWLPGAGSALPGALLMSSTTSFLLTVGVLAPYLHDERESPDWVIEPDYTRRRSTVGVTGGVVCAERSAHCCPDRCARRC